MSNTRKGDVIPNQREHERVIDKRNMFYTINPTGFAAAINGPHDPIGDDLSSGEWPEGYMNFVVFPNFPRWKPVPSGPVWEAEQTYYALRSLIVEDGKLWRPFKRSVQLPEEEPDWELAQENGRIEFDGCTLLLRGDLPDLWEESSPITSGDQRSSDGWVWNSQSPGTTGLVAPTFDAIVDGIFEDNDVVWSVAYPYTEWSPSVSVELNHLNSLNPGLLVNDGKAYTSYDWWHGPITSGLVEPTWDAFEEYNSQTIFEGSDLGWVIAADIEDGQTLNHVYLPYRDVPLGARITVLSQQSIFNSSSLMNVYGGQGWRSETLSAESQQNITMIRSPLGFWDAENT